MLLDIFKIFYFITVCETRENSNFIKNTLNNIITTKSFRTDANIKYMKWAGISNLGLRTGKKTVFEF